MTLKDSNAIILAVFKLALAIIILPFFLAVKAIKNRNGEEK